MKYESDHWGRKIRTARNLLVTEEVIKGKKRIIHKINDYNNIFDGPS
jgi:hypothetical protein